MHIHGGDVYTYKNLVDYSANINPLGIPESIVKAVTEGAKLSAQYPDVQCRELRQALSDFENMPVEQIICGNGAADLIFSLVLALKPKKALLLAPTFHEYEQALRAVGCDIEYYILSEEKGFVLDKDYIDQLNTTIDMIFICNPNNPTGLVVEPGFIEEILAICEKNNIFLVLDECFNDFLEQPDYYTLKYKIAEFPNLFILKAFTKLYAMAGLRLGYSFSANQELLDKMREVTQPWSVSTPAQYAGIAALKELDYVARAKDIIKAERRFLSENLKTLGFTVYPGTANYLFFKGPLNLSEEIKKQGYMIRDCSNYYSLTKGFYRIAVRLHDDNLGLIKALKCIVK